VRQRSARIQHLEAQIRTIKQTPDELAKLVKQIETSSRSKLADLRAALANETDRREAFLALFPDGLVFSPGDNAGYVRVRFRYLTLVMDPAPIVDPIDLRPKYTLESPERLIYNTIVTRDILRPYVKRQAVPRPGAPASPGTSPTPATPAGPESFRIVSLSEWMGEPEIHVRDLTNQRTLRYRPGDNLAGGTVVMVDYRRMPMPGTIGLESYSRVIVKIGSDFWAIEHGKTLAEKYKLQQNDWPEHLAKLGK